MGSIQHSTLRNLALREVRWDTWLLTTPTDRFLQFLQQRLGLLEICRIGPFSEPAVNRCEQSAGLCPLALGLP